MFHFKAIYPIVSTTLNETPQFSVFQNYKYILFLYLVIGIA